MIIYVFSQTKVLLLQIKGLLEIGPATGFELQLDSLGQNFLQKVLGISTATPPSHPS